MTYLPCVHTYIHTYKQTDRQTDRQTDIQPYIHKSIQTYSYTYTWLQMVRLPPNPPTGGGGNIMCICSIFVCIHNKNDIPTLRAHVHTYIQTDRQTDIQPYIHKSIQTYSYTYTWLQMVRLPPNPPTGGGAATLCVYVVSLFAYTIKMTYLPCVHTYIHTYKQTDRQTDRHTAIHT